VVENLIKGELANGRNVLSFSAKPRDDKGASKGLE
jgi:hypothetical protein